MLAICSPTPLRAGFVGDMSYPNPHFPSHHNSSDYPQRHPYITPSYTPAPWEGPDQRLNYNHYNQWNLAYRPRLDGYSFTNPQSVMASPDIGTDPNAQSHSLPHMTPTETEYPDDPSFETGDDGRVEMGQDEIDAIIRNKRKVRDPKACYACHRRKVKCNRELPCDSCVKRDHPELCSYERPTKRRRIALTTQLPRNEDEVKSPVNQSGPNITVPKEQWERINSELRQLKDQLNVIPPEPVRQQHAMDYAESGISQGAMGDERDGTGIYAPSNQMGTMHLGSRSVLAYMMGLNRTKSTQEAARSLLEENILPKLGLDNESVTYPFVDLWSTDNSIQDISGLCKALPNDRLCKEFFYAYRDVACTIYPVVPDAADFERELDYMLRNRAELEINNFQPDQTNPLGVSLSYLALVFAVLASGAQCTDLPAKERELTSQVYTCCSYQALRMANFMTHPNLEIIEASLIIGNVLSFNMNPGVAYIFTGMVIRMAYSIGLHINTSGFTDTENWLRRRVWWALAWQDSHFSISYDRPSSVASCHPEIPYNYDSTPGTRTYAESMYSIIQLTQTIIRDRSSGPRSQMHWSTIREYKEVVSSVVNDGHPYLRERSLCTRMTQHLERLALKLHSSYVISELCRPALKDSVNDGPALTPNSNPLHSPPTNVRRKGSSSRSHSASTPASASSPNVPNAEPNQIPQLRRECIRSLEATVEAYVELHSYSETAARSWIGIQRSISAAFLLGTLPETNQEPRILNLLRELERCINQRTMDDPTFEKIRRDENGMWDGQNPQSGTGVGMGIGAGTTEAPHWARSMTRSLNALGKLNETLAGHKAGNGTGSQSQGPGQPYPTGSSVTGYGASSGTGMGMRGQQALPAMKQGQSQSQKSQQQHPQNQGLPQQYSTANMGLVNRQPQSQNQQTQQTQAQSQHQNQGHAIINTSWGPMPQPYPYTHGQRHGLPLTPDGNSPSATGIATGAGSGAGSGAGAGGSAQAEWNYSNLRERGAEWIQPALWK